jgi:hypothetical protein
MESLLLENVSYPGFAIIFKVATALQFQLEDSASPLPSENIQHIIGGHVNLLLIKY